MSEELLIEIERAHGVAGRMAQSHQTGDPIVTTDSMIADLLAAPLGPEWTVELLAEELLVTIAARASDEAQVFEFDGEVITDRQSRRLLRPLLACLATKSAVESGIPTNLYGGRIGFERPSDHGPVWIIGEFENTPTSARVALNRVLLPSRNPEVTAGQLPDLAVEWG